MSDFEDQDDFPNEEDNAIEPGTSDASPRHHDDARHQKSRGAFDDDEDEEEEEEEEEEDSGRSRKRTKHRHKRNFANEFLDIEAEVTDEEEEEEDEDDFGGPDGFIEAPQDGDEDDLHHRSRNALLDRKRDQDFDEGDLERIAEDLSKRYSNRAVRYSGDMNDIPQRLLMPSVNDANLWQIRVKPGKERDIVFALLRKSIDLQYSANPLNILSAFQRDSLPGMIYVEARSAQQVNKACAGLVGVYPSRGIHLVPIEEMASLLQIKKQDLTVTPGSWVRIRRGKYQGDLAQVVDITENGEEVGLKFIPRIDLNPRDDNSADARKRKKPGLVGTSNMRPPQRFFNYEEVVKVYGRKAVSKRNHLYVFQNETYRDGFIEKDFKVNAISMDDVNPTLDEITRFTRGRDGAENEGNVDLSIIAEASRKAAIAVLQPGDHVEVFEGEQTGMHGVVQEISQDVVTISAVGVDIDGQRIDLPARSVRKRFKPGDHVKVMTGKNADETGLVVSVSDNVVTFLSDLSLQEVSVFSKDLREAAEVGSSSNVVGNYELHDLVQLDQQTVGVIFKTERDSFRVVDQNGQVRLVQPHQISMRRDSGRSFAIDSQGHELRLNDNVKEVDGEGRKGRVLHIHQSQYAFLHNREITENGGIFVARCRSLASVAPKGNLIKPGADLSKMNPAMAVPTGGMVGSGSMGRGPRDRSIGSLVIVIKGVYKGYAGTIKDTNGTLARVELQTGNKLISIEKEKLKHRRPDGTLVDLDSRGPPQGGGGGGGYNRMGPPSSTSRTPNPYASGGGRTPAWGNSGRTPNPYASGDGKTPAWNASSRTPNPYAEGGKTPAWNASSRTPNPYAAQDGGRTPAWPGGRTPNPYASGSNSFGGASSGWDSGGWNANGGASPVRTSWDDWGGAPTPAAAATPAPGHGYQGTPMSVATPAPVYSAPTNASSAPTPGPSLYHRDDTRDRYEPSENWLLDIPEQFLTRVNVEVHGTMQDDPFWEGQLEALQGVVTGAMKASENVTQLASVSFKTRPPGVPAIVNVPIKYLIPVVPNRVSQDALYLDGPRRGEAIVLRSAPERTVTVSAPDLSGGFFEVETDQLVLLAPAD